MPPSVIRNFRNDRNDSFNNESPAESERVPFLTQEQSFDLSPDLENGIFQDPTGGSPNFLKLATVPCSSVDDDGSSCDQVTPYFFSKRRWAWPIPALGRLVAARPTLVQKEHILEKSSLRKRHRTTPLRRVLRLLTIALMLLGIVEFIALACGLITAFFPDEVEDSLDEWKPTARLPSELGQWPTDFSADVQPVACHSHNDYWRKEPLFSALDAGCTGVEADVWLFDEDLFVGHSTQSLTPERTLRSLYVDPILKLLDQQNPLTSFHPTDDFPRNGVFDTDPSQTLILLIDFKNDGDAIWPYVSEQLQPLREKKFLTYFNGSSIVEGPVTVVVTGNAPFSAVVANPHYRDIFFDAPLDLMDKLSDMIPPADLPVPYDLPLGDVHATAAGKRSDENQGQGHSGSAPTNPAIYSPANSYYASVDFKSSIGFPWRGQLSSKQKEKLRKQILGAHARGLKVRYWGVPSWPRGLRNYLWRVLVREGVDYLNVDDLHSATTGNWGWGKKGPWWAGPWRFWPSTP